MKSDKQLSIDTSIIHKLHPLYLFTIEVGRYVQVPRCLKLSSTDW